MNQYILSLGSNLSPRETYLQNAILKISEFASVVQVAPLFENPPLLPPSAPEPWYQFFLNTAVWIKTELNPESLLQQLHTLERAAGREKDRATWAPRTLDIDIILMFNNTGDLVEHHSPKLQIPHASWLQRNFVVTPVMHLLNSSKLGMPLGLLQKHRSLTTPLCAFAAILNVTPDSFSEDTLSTEPHKDKMRRLLKLHPAILDVGAESTRPGATPISAEEEWQRLEPFLIEWKEQRHRYPFTKLSLDTRHALTAQKALDFGVSILNDVSGLESQEMQDVATHFEQVILMHSLSIPADPKAVLPKEETPTTALKKWLDQKLEGFSQSLRARLIFDPGIGFGKTPLQSLSLMQDLEDFKSYDLPLYIGHSRKSFMNLWSQEKYSERDFETLGVSAALLSSVEYLRVHHLEAHQRLQKSILALGGA